MQSRQPQRHTKHVVGVIMYIGFRGAQYQILHIYMYIYIIYVQRIPTGNVNTFGGRGYVRDIMIEALHRPHVHIILITIYHAVHIRYYTVKYPSTHEQLKQFNHNATRPRFRGPPLVDMHITMYTIVWHAAFTMSDVSWQYTYYYVINRTSIAGHTTKVATFERQQTRRQYNK